MGENVYLLSCTAADPSILSSYCGQGRLEPAYFRKDTGYTCDRVPHSHLHLWLEVHIHMNVILIWGF